MASTTQTGKKAARAKKSGPWAAIQRHPYRASLGAAAAVGVGAILSIRRKKARAVAKAPSEGRRAAAK